MVGTGVLGRLGGLRALGLGAWGLRTVDGEERRWMSEWGGQGKATPLTPMSLQGGERRSHSSSSTAQLCSSLGKSWGSGRCQGPSSMEGPEEG